MGNLFKFFLILNMLSKLSAGTTLASLVQLTDARLNTLASLQSSVAPMVQA